MKKIFSNFFRFLNSRFLQFLLFFGACLSWIECNEIGRRTFWQAEDGVALNEYRKGYGGSYSETIIGGASVDVSTGFTGGAIAMGLIACMCIFGIVWIEINKQKP